MKDHEIRDLAQRFGLTGLLTSAHQTKQFFAFVREIEKSTKEAQALKTPAALRQEAIDAQRTYGNALVKEFNESRSK